MDPTVFDRVSRLLAATPSRRRTLAGLGGALAAILTRPAPEAAAAPCRKGKKRCKGRCIPKRQCCTNANCRPKGSGKICRRGRCQCPSGQKVCQGRCVASAVCCGGCAADQACNQGTCVARRCGLGAPCRVFVTSTSTNGDLGGLLGADAICQALANASPLTAGGTYKAWLSDATASPNTRFTNTANTGPYVLVDQPGTVVADTYAELTSQTLENPIIVDEDGNAVDTTVWTGTLANGNGSGTHCFSWTSDVQTDLGTVGESDPLITNDDWSGSAVGSCGDPFAFPFYCFEQG